MIRREHNQAYGNMVYYTYQQFESLPNVSNSVSTRLGGVSKEHLRSLNLSFSPMVGDEEEAVIANRDRFYAQLSIGPQQIAQAELVHGTHIAVVTEQTPRGTFEKLPKTDGLVTNIADIALFIPVADCAAISFYDPKAHVIAMIHAGWKGTVKGIIGETVQKMRELGSTSSDILVGISPVLEACCYQVRQDLVNAVTQAFPSYAHTFFTAQGDDIHYQFNFLGLLRWQLEENGILTSHIEDSGICTACHTDEFYSHRAEQGKTGRFAGLIMMRGS